jgi:hypothetical protein
MYTGCDWYAQRYVAANLKSRVRGAALSTGVVELCLMLICSFLQSNPPDHRGTYSRSDCVAST